MSNRRLSAYSIPPAGKISALGTKDLGDIDNFKYRYCALGRVHASGMVSDNWDEKRDWGIDVLFLPPGGSWKNKGPFKVSVTLTSPANHRRAPYGVLSATIQRSE
jgi:hypothetical protein